MEKKCSRTDGKKMITKKIQNRIHRRNHIIDNWDRYLNESVYYRTWSEEIKKGKKIVLFNIKNKEGKCLIK